jgi:dolichol kinase
MTRKTWALLVAIYGVAAIAVLLLGAALPPCFGNAQGQVSPECIANWEAGRWLPSRLIDNFGAPLGAALTFAALTCGTLVVDLVRRRRSRGAK